MKNERNFVVNVRKGIRKNFTQIQNEIMLQIVKDFGEQ